MNRKGIDLEAIERDLEERRWLKSGSGSYSYSEDSDSKKSTTYSSKDSEDSGYKRRDGPEGCKFLGKMYDPGEWIELENDKCKCDEGGSTNWVNCELLGNVATDDGGKDGGVQLDCKFEGKMYDPGQWIDLGTEKCKCDEGGSSKLVECEQYKIDGEGEGGEGEDTLPSTTSGDEGGVTNETEATFFSKVDSDDGEIKTGLDGCPSVGVVNTDSIVVNFAYMVKIKPIDAAGTLAMYTEIERKIFDSLASEIVDCSEESPKIVVAKSKESERNLEVMLTDSYPDDQVVGTCNGVQNCFIVHGAITVTYTENETKEYATLYTMNTIKKKMDSGEFNNQGDIISVEYLGKPDKYSELKSTEPIEQDTNKWTIVPIVLICSVLFLTLASFLAKILYDSKRNSEKNNETYMEENNDFLVEESVDENLAKILYHSKRNSEKNNETSMEENNNFAIEETVDEKLAKILYDSKSSSEKSNEISMEENNDYLVEVPFDEKLPRMEDVDISIEERVDEKLPGMGVDVV
eukprot:CAMPEP_0194271294 /NCGR_PEP_ID=MMETSP0169-20130528/5125_1 /TAXON_ID=218684 /ORGANISM="Corethron pennatum, Strain L29A3" /LENGTH=518 /DNA_ID=CAMNT_0039013617 /DNA_START=366 /DNA_END=1922 /DNA_ORIENTATION=+